MTIGLNNILTTLVVLTALGAGIFSSWKGLDRLADAEIRVESSQVPFADHSGQKR